MKLNSLPDECIFRIFEMVDEGVWSKEFSFLCEMCKFLNIRIEKYCFHVISTLEIRYPWMLTSIQEAQLSMKQAKALIVKPRCLIIGCMPDPRALCLCIPSSPSSSRFPKPTFKRSLYTTFKRSTEGSVSVVHNGLAYIMSGTEENALESVEVFNPIAGRVLPGPSLPSGLRKFAACSHNGRLLLVGGLAGWARSLDVYVLDPSSSTWLQCPEMALAPFVSNSLHSAVSHQGKLWVIGGIICPRAARCINGNCEIVNTRCVRCGANGPEFDENSMPAHAPNTCTYQYDETRSPPQWIVMPLSSLPSPAQPKTFVYRESLHIATNGFRLPSPVIERYDGERRCWVRVTRDMLAIGCATPIAQCVVGCCFMSFEHEVVKICNLDTGRWSECKYDSASVSSLRCWQAGHSDPEEASSGGTMFRKQSLFPSCVAEMHLIRGTGLYPFLERVKFCI